MCVVGKKNTQKWPTHSFVLFISDMSLEQEITWNKMVSVNLYALGKNSTKRLAMKKPNTCHVLFAVKFYKGSFPLHFYGISLFAF